jgi:pimeloyl-ACP methyl ester carboxylesterase
MPAAHHVRCVPPRMEEQWASVAGGRLRYLVGGRGPSLVLVHGIAASSFSFRLNCAELTEHFRLFVPDLMNVGYSDRIPGLDGSLHANATRLLEFLDQAGIETADVLGSSHGGAVVMELAALAPERFRRVILVSPANPFANRYDAVLKFYLGTAGTIFMRLVPFLPGRFWDYGIGRMYADPRRMPKGTGIGHARPLRIRGTVGYILDSLRTFAADIEGLRPKLPAISKIPTVLIWGDRDPVVEIQSAYQLQKAIEAELIVLPGLGHLPYEESPAEFNRVLLDYLQGRTQENAPSTSRRA